MEVQIIIQLILATFLGALIGLEREIKRKGAGLQTYSLVGLGSCLFASTIFSLAELKIIDPSPLIIGIAVGVGFIGAGVIFRGEDQIQGLTTAAGLWMTAAIGLTVAAQFYFLAIFATLLAILILAGFGLVEKKWLKR